MGGRRWRRGGTRPALSVYFFLFFSPVFIFVVGWGRGNERNGYPFLYFLCHFLSLGGHGDMGFRRSGSPTRTN